MTAVVFIHGTGVREPHFSALFTRVTRGLTEFAPGLDTTPYYWGGACGATLRGDGASLPLGERDGRSRGIDENGAGPDGTDLWDLLYQDPLAELESAAGPAPGAAELPPGAPLPGERPRALLAALGPHLTREDDASTGLGPGLATAAADSGLGPRLAAAAASLAGSPLLGPAATALDADTFAQVLARALVATAIAAELADDAPLIPDGDTRDALSDRLAVHFGARPRGADRGLRGLLLRPGLRLGTRYAVRRRRALTDAAHPAAGDILLYLTRGEPFRQGLRALVRTLEPPVVLVGHSLGGIIALDTLISTPLPEVALLVTVGSQGPFLYETGALPGLDHPSPLPDHVPDWLNLYDRRDLLGYVGGPLFPGRVTDVEIDNRQPFPAAHSAYWGNKAVYEAIAARLPAARAEVR